MKAILLLCLSICVLSCKDVEQKSTSYGDTIELLDHSLNGKDFRDLVGELRRDVKTVYIALDSSKNHWPKQAGSIKIETISGFNKQLDVYERGSEKRFVINPPIFSFFKDSAIVNIYSFTFNNRMEYNYAKKKNKWKFVGVHEYIY